MICFNIFAALSLLTNQCNTAPNKFAYISAVFNPPASGETITKSSKFKDLIYFTITDDPYK